MNKELLAKFIELAEKELSSVILTYKMELKVDNEYLLSLICEKIVIQMGVFPSHNFNITTIIRQKGNDRMFGLGLIVELYNSNYNLGAENIENINDLLFSIQQHVKALIN